MLCHDNFGIYTDRSAKYNIICDLFLADYTEVLKKSVGLIKDAPATTPTGDTKTETSKEDAPKTKG